MNDWLPAFNRCIPFLEAALGYADGTHTVDDVRAAIEGGKAQFWPGEKSAVVTEILTFPRKKVCHYWLAGGDLDELLDMEPSIETWAKAIGCESMTIAGRPGWHRALKGYRKAFTTLSKGI